SPAPRLPRGSRRGARPRPRPASVPPSAPPAVQSPRFGAKWFPPSLSSSPSGDSCPPYEQAKANMSRRAFQVQFIRHQRDELAVCRLVVQRADIGAELPIDFLDAAAAPGHLDGVANGPLDLAGR